MMNDQDARQVEDYFYSRRPNVRRKSFELYSEPFRKLNAEECRSLFRVLDLRIEMADASFSDFRVSYQSLLGGFTVCSVLLNGKLYSGASHCSKVDRWLKIRGQMQAFRRAIEQSQGVSI